MPQEKEILNFHPEESVLVIDVQVILFNLHCQLLQIVSKTIYYP